MRITNAISHSDEPMLGQQPDIIWGTGAPDGDYGQFKTAVVGSIYARRGGTTVPYSALFEKRTDNDRDDDWGALGGVGVIQQRVSYTDFTDGGAAVGTLDLTETIPAGALVYRVVLVNVTGFAGDTSAALTVGDGTDVDRYNATTINVFSTVAALDGGVPSGTVVHTAAATVRLTITSAADFTSVNAGAATVRLYYFL